MASIRILEQMDQPEKRVHRPVQCEAIRLHFPRPEKEAGLLVTLGGLYTDKQGNLIKLSEMWYLLEVLGWNPKRIVSVDITKEVVDRNNTNRDPRCKGIRNVYMPLTYKRKDGEDCPVQFGQIGGIERVISNLISMGEKVSVVLSDLMGTVRINAPDTIGMAYDLSKQKGKVLLLNNFTNLERRNGVTGHGIGKHNASTELWEGDTVGRHGLPFKKVAHGIWKEFTLNLNDGSENKQFSYTGNRTPMQTVFLVKTAGTKQPPKAIVQKEERSEKVKCIKRTGNYSAGAKKAWATRRANAK